RRHTRLQGDWSSDVCSSDLMIFEASWFIPPHPAPPKPLILGQCVLLASSSARMYFGHLKSIVRLEKSYLVISMSPAPSAYGKYRSEERRVGKECRSRQWRAA